MVKLMWHRAREIGRINANPMLRLALWAYSGEVCQGCGKKIVTIADIIDTAWWPHAGGRIGHEKCYRRAMARQTTNSPTEARTTRYESRARRQPPSSERSGQSDGCGGDE